MEEIDLSGKELTEIPPVIFTAGLEALTVLRCNVFPVV
jgi:hypothetical protein